MARWGSERSATLNPRLPIEQLCQIILHAGDRLLFVDPQFLPAVLPALDVLPCIEGIVVLGGPETIRGLDERFLSYEVIVAAHPAHARWGGFDERTAAGLCYTSGTSGMPKGVLYSHRSNFLLALTLLGPDLFGLTERDVVMAIVPMFHANGWGLVFAAPAVGAKLVLPGPKLDGRSVYELLQNEGVTFAAAVPTIWQDLLVFLRSEHKTLTSLRRAVVGGSALPDSLANAFREEHGVDVRHAWGMTELSPLGTLAAPTAAGDELQEPDRRALYAKQGRPPLAIDLILTDDDGEILPHDGASPGHLRVRGPYAASGYFGSDAALLDGTGFMATGDLATIDAHGFMKITDRAKDVIKSGGEWISSIDLENAACGHPKVARAAVIGVQHERWGERPLLFIEPGPDGAPAPNDIRDFLRGAVASWWVPEDIRIVDSIPLGSTGKVDKARLRTLIETPSPEPR